MSTASFEKFDNCGIAEGIGCIQRKEIYRH